MLIIGAIVWGMGIGWIGQMLLGKARKAKDRNWGQAIIAGVVGSVVGGTIGSLLMGEGFDLRMGGIIASIAGAVIVLLVWDAIASRKK